MQVVEQRWHFLLTCVFTTFAWFTGIFLNMLIFVPSSNRAPQITLEQFTRTTDRSSNDQVYLSRCKTDSVR